MVHGNTRIPYVQLDGYGRGFLAVLAALAVVAALGLGASWYMEHHGHVVTGMTNQVVWGTPHVFAVFLIVAASGALNVASISSVFERVLYKPLARLSGLLAVALLAGGLAVLVLDLGRPDRLWVAMTHYNFKSIFAWNIILYTGFMVIVGTYLWTMMDRRAGHWYKPAAYTAFIWRLVLTTGTGSIFGFLVARQGYDAAIMAPMFIAMSFAFGKALFLLVLLAVNATTGRPLGDVVVRRLQHLTGIVLAAGFYFVVVYHLTNLYATENHAWEAFILADGGVYTALFWVVQVALGTLVPLVLLLHPGLAGNRTAVAAASGLIVAGGLAMMYVLIIGGQAFPLVLFPGMEVSSSFFDGAVAAYAPSLPEVVLGVSGFAIAFLVLMVGAAAFRILPASLADAVVDPDHVHQIVDAADEAAVEAAPQPAE